MNSPSLLGQSAKYAFAKGLPGILNLLAIVLYTRLLKPSSYGDYVLVIAGVSLINRTGFGWLQLGLLRFYAAYRQQPAKIFSTVAYGFFGLCFLSVVVGAGVYLAWDEVPSRDFVLMGVGLLWVQAWFNNNLEVARARLNPGQYGRLAFIRSLIGLLIGSILAWSGLGVYGVLFGLILANLIPSIWLFRRNRQLFNLRDVDKRLLRKILRYGLPLSILASLSFILSSSDKFIIMYLLGDGQVGLYASGYDLANQLVTAICMIIGLAATPLAINKLESEGWQAAKKQFFSNGQFFIGLSLPTIVMLVVLSDPVVDLIVGPDFREAAAEIFPWIMLGAFFMGLKSYYLDSAFYLHKRTGLQLVTVVPAAILNVALNFWLIPKIGISGAAYSTVISYFVAMGFSLFIVIRYFNMPLAWMEFVRVGIVSLALGGILLLVQNLVKTPLVILIFLGVLIYCILGLWMKLAMFQEGRVLLRAYRK